jgi:hypothetical protein
MAYLNNGQASTMIGPAVICTSFLLNFCAQRHGQRCSGRDSDRRGDLFEHGCCGQHVEKLDPQQGTNSSASGSGCIPVRRLQQRVDGRCHRRWLERQGLWNQAASTVSLPCAGLRHVRSAW